MFSDGTYFKFCLMGTLTPGEDNSELRLSNDNGLYINNAII
jgi:hypothetical protein